MWNIATEKQDVMCHKTKETIIKLTLKAMQIIEIDSGANLRSEGGGGVVEEKEIACSGSFVEVETAAFLGGKFPTLLHTLLDALSARFHDVEVTFSLW